MKIDLKQAMGFPFRDPNYLTKWGMGLLFSFFCFLLLPIFCVMGYTLETFRSCSDGNDETMPAWDQFVNYGIKGFVMFLISLAYMAIPLGITMFSVGSAFVSLLSGARAAGGHGGLGLVAGALGVSGILGLVGLVATFVVSALMPAVMARFARTDSAAEAFNIPGILADIMVAPMEYLLICVINIAIVVLFSFVPVIGTLVGGFYASMVSANLLGQYCRAHLSTI
jgi:hypothetical protein